MNQCVEISGTAVRATGRVLSALGTLSPVEVGDMAHEAVEFIRNNYLRGQALERITGETYESVHAYYVNGEWWIRPGVGIAGCLNYLARWVGTDREFMRPGFDRFLQGRGRTNMLESMTARIEKVWKETR